MANVILCSGIAISLIIMSIAFLIRFSVNRKIINQFQNIHEELEAMASILDFMHRKMNDWLEEVESLKYKKGKK